MAKLKIFCINGTGRDVFLTAAPSAKAAAAILGQTTYGIKEYEHGFCELDEAVAMTRPGAVFRRPMNSDRWTLWKDESGAEVTDGGHHPLEPAPIAEDYRHAGHHWLDVYDSDGHFFETVVMQWQPGVRRWCHSGMVGSGRDVSTAYWKYVAPCPLPDIKRG